MLVKLYERPYNTAISSAHLPHGVEVAVEQDAGVRVVGHLTGTMFVGALVVGEWVTSTKTLSKIKKKRWVP